MDFCKLLPKERLHNSDEQRLELVQQGGHTFFVPADKEVVGITYFTK